MSALSHFMHFSVEFRDNLAGFVRTAQTPSRKQLSEMLSTAEGFLDHVSDDLLLERLGPVKVANRALADAAVAVDKSAFDAACKAHETALNRVMAYTMSPEDFQRMKKRNRPSAAKTIKRNVEICDLRKADRKKWSMPQLARKYRMKRQSIDNILKEEKKWRRLLSELPSD